MSLAAFCVAQVYRRQRTLQIAPHMEIKPVIGAGILAGQRELARRGILKARTGCQEKIPAPISFPNDFRIVIPEKPYIPRVQRSPCYRSVYSSCQKCLRSKESCRWCLMAKNTMVFCRTK